MRIAVTGLCDQCGTFARSDLSESTPAYQHTSMPGHGIAAPAVTAAAPAPAATVRPIGKCSLHFNRLSKIEVM